MMQMPARTVYVDAQVRERPNCLARLDRMLPHIRCDDVRPFDAEAQQEIAQIGQRRHGKDDFGDDAVFVFRAYDEEWDGRYFHYREGEGKLTDEGIACQDALELNPVFGCPFRCAYCGFGRLVTIMLDVERFVARVPEMFERYPEQQLYKCSNMTDLPPFEPEHDCVLPLVRLFAREERRFLMLFTKSDATDFLLDAEHGGQTLISWSLSSCTVSDKVDKRTATMEQRIEAMRKCREAGYHVRARISPIVPVRNWREEYGEMFDLLIECGRPELVTLEMLGWFDFEDLGQIIPQDTFDPTLYQAAERAQDEMRGKRKSPFPYEVRREVYEFCIDRVKAQSPDTPVSICHGTPRMWEALGPKVGMKAECFVCNCGPNSVPGHPLMTASRKP